MKKGYIAFKNVIVIIIKSCFDMDYEERENWSS